MGEIWVAEQADLGRVVAIKFMAQKLTNDVELRERFKREARAAAMLRTRHVVDVTDHGLHGDTPYIVMELLDGEDLRQRLRRVGRLSIDETILVARQIGRALTAVHAAGIVHRDLKPANAFLARIDDEEVLKLVDFGIAKVEDDVSSHNKTATGTIMGSPRYMSPEQARSTRKADSRSDLWALGVILFRCLTGEELFDGETAGDILVKICAEPIPAPSDVRPSLPAELDGLFRRALQRDVSRRFPDAESMVAAFECAANGVSCIEDAPVTVRHGKGAVHTAPALHTAAPAQVAVPASITAAATTAAPAASSPLPLVQPVVGTLTGSTASAVTIPLKRSGWIVGAAGLAAVATVAVWQLVATTKSIPSRNLVPSGAAVASPAALTTHTPRQNTNVVAAESAANARPTVSPTARSTVVAPLARTLPPAPATKPQTPRWTRTPLTGSASATSVPATSATTPPAPASGSVPLSRTPPPPEPKPKPPSKPGWGF